MGLGAITRPAASITCRADQRPPVPAEHPAPHRARGRLQDGPRDLPREALHQDQEPLHPLPHLRKRGPALHLQHLPQVSVGESLKYFIVSLLLHRSITAAPPRACPPLIACCKQRSSNRSSLTMRRSPHPPPPPPPQAAAAGADALAQVPPAGLPCAQVHRLPKGHATPECHGRQPATGRLPPVRRQQRPRVTRRGAWRGGPFAAPSHPPAPPYQRAAPRWGWSASGRAPPFLRSRASCDGGRPVQWVRCLAGSRQRGFAGSRQSAVHVATHVAPMSPFVSSDSETPHVPGPRDADATAGPL